jgi:hypothetical protein
MQQLKKQLQLEELLLLLVVLVGAVEVAERVWELRLLLEDRLFWLRGIVGRLRFTRILDCHSGCRDFLSYTGEEERRTSGGAVKPSRRRRRRNKI